ncbi:hypothetical protein [Streptomyces sp. NPDC006552]
MKVEQRRRRDLTRPGQTTAMKILIILIVIAVAVAWFMKSQKRR